MANGPSPTAGPESRTNRSATSMSPQANPENGYRAYLLHLRGGPTPKRDWDRAIADDTQTLDIPPRNGSSALFARCSAGPIATPRRAEPNKPWPTMMS